MIVTLTGSNDFMLAAELNQRVAEYVAANGDLGVERYDGEELDPKDLPGILQAMPFLADSRLVVLRQPSAQKALQEQLEPLLNEVPDTTQLIVVEPKPDKRTSYYKALQKTDFKNYEPLNENQLADWLVGQAEGTINNSDAHYLVQRVGTNQLLLSNELAKLRNYDKQITRQAIDALTEPTPQSSTFDLLDAAFSGQRAKVTRLYQEQRQQKVEPLAMLALIGWQLHALAVVKTAGERNAADIAKEAKLNPFVVRKTQPIARHLSLAELKELIARAAALDVQLKSRPIEADDALLEYLLSLGTTS